MTKPTFIAAIKKATLLQNAYTGDKKRMLAMWDSLYNSLKDENEADVCHALDVLGKSNEVINYANIRRYVDESRSERERGKPKREPDKKVELVPQSEVRGMLDKLFGKNWRVRDDGRA